MLSFLANFANKAEIRESKDEMLVGEIVRAMARRSWPATSFRATDDRQWMRFRAVGDPILHHAYVTLDRKTGGSALQEALIGSKATLTIAGEIKNMLTDPDDIVKMYTTDLANMFKMPVLGGIKLNHELNSVFATTTALIDIDTYVNKGEKGAEGLAALLGGTVDKLREKLQPYKR